MIIKVFNLRNKLLIFVLDAVWSVDFCSLQLDVWRHLSYIQLNVKIYIRVEARLRSKGGSFDQSQRDGARQLKREQLQHTYSFTICQECQCIFVATPFLTVIQKESSVI